MPTTNCISSPLLPCALAHASVCACLPHPPGADAAIPAQPSPALVFLFPTHAAIAKEPSRNLIMLARLPTYSEHCIEQPCKQGKLETRTQAAPSLRATTGGGLRSHSHAQNTRLLLAHGPAAAVLPPHASRLRARARACMPRAQAPLGTTLVQPGLAAAVAACRVHACIASSAAAGHQSPPPAQPEEGEGTGQGGQTPPLPLLAGVVRGLEGLMDAAGKGAGLADAGDLMWSCSFLGSLGACASQAPPSVCTVCVC